MRFTASAMAILLAGAAANAQFLPRPGGGPGTAGSPLSGGIGTAPPAAGFSPYLNLTRGGSAAINYYGIVRPQINFQSQLQTVQAQQQAGSASFEPDNPLMPGLVVGTRVRFLNTQPYFLNLQGGATTGGASGFGMGAARGISGVQGGMGTGIGTGATFGGFGAAASGASHSGGGGRGPR